MGVVIGYKGSASERHEAWVTMLKLRKQIKAMEAYNKANPTAEFKPDPTEVIEWHREEFVKYVA